MSFAHSQSYPPAHEHQHEDLQGVVQHSGTNVCVSRWSGQDSLPLAVAYSWLVSIWTRVKAYRSA